MAAWLHRFVLSYIGSIAMTDHKTVREALQSADRYMSIADPGVMTAQKIKKALATLDKIMEGK